MAIPEYRKSPREYMYARVLESLRESALAHEMVKRGFLQNAASKAFLAVKALVSALVVKNLGKLLEGRSERERSWYENVGYSAPTTGLIGISKDLGRLGFDVELIVRTALMLHSFSYNGFDPNFVNYANEDEVVSDVMEVINFIKEVAKRWFGDIWDEKLEQAWLELQRLD